MLIGGRGIGRRVRHVAGGGGSVRPPGGAAVITVNSNSDLQTIVGWSGHVQIGTFSDYWDEIADQAVNDLGLNSLRLEVRSGCLRNDDFHQDFEDGVITVNQERDRRFAPHTGAAFKPAMIDYNIARTVERFRTALAARGEQLHLNLTMTDYWTQGRNYNVPVSAPSGTFADDEAITWASGSSQLMGRFNAASSTLRVRADTPAFSGSAPGSGVTITGSTSGVTAVTTGAASLVYAGDYQMRSNPARVADLILACVQHIDANYTWLPDEITIMNEPDDPKASWSGAQLAANIKAVADALAGAGFGGIPITCPATSNEGNAVSYFNPVWDYLPGSGHPNRAKVHRLAYHRYSAQNVLTTQAIAARARAVGVMTGMAEWNQATGDTLHQDLKWGESSVWEQFVTAFQGTNAADKGSYIGIDTANPDPAAAVFIRNEGRKFQQYMRFVRAGAVRKVTDHSNCGTPDATFQFHNYDGLAFLNANGKYVVVVRTRATGDVWIDGLPAGTYGIEYTVGTSWHQTMADVVIAAGDALTFNVASSTVSFWTIFQR